MKQEKILNQSVTAKYNFNMLGKYKRNCWAFQKEWRYIITSSPCPIREIEENPTMDQQREFFRRIECLDTPAPFEKIFLSIDDKYLSNINILVGPKASTGDKILIRTLASQFAQNAFIYESSIKIR